ncbi:branched-chain amino acid ABC transporter permease [Micromonospora echinofusca]|uniref:Branched-chain amino acid ABC transporter permease n=1 Tax=Micromonospora echinofusca TaxID=47858 RepID=A0ABS3VVI1_MICEH|nr:branched-chain amino acid ABC transporter permease [Micromonospora echinofusca]MBO4208535.1 branched-chain amino acid ABC transporter permease [Micromonospora echinofusca]
MPQLIEVITSGLSLGVVYALIALGFAVIFKATGVLNFAHGSLLLLGAYTVAEVAAKAGFVIGLVVGITVAAFAALVADRLVFRFVRGGDHVVLAMITLGLDIVLLARLVNLLGTRVLPIHDPWRDVVVSIGAVALPQTRIAAFVTASMLLAVFFAALRFSNWGVAMRATTQDREAAALMGIRPGLISASAWMIGGGLATVAGVFLSVFPTPGLETALSLTALKALPAAVLGGLDSLGGALVGGLTIGLAEALIAGYAQQLSFLGTGFADVMPYLVLFVVLLVRPTGMFGSRELTRV